jgi:hypothetical protein
MIIGIVGSEGAKFTPETEAKARECIRALIHRPCEVISGACHLGGIDTWAIEEAKKLGLPTEEFPPKVKSWEHGYKPRNLLIAERAHEVYCITLKELPPTYTGMRFRLCYHCGTTDHVKSGGCWTVKQAKRMGKPTGIFVI